MSFLRRRRRRFLLFSCMQWFSPLLLRRIRPEPVTLNRLAAARFVFIFGMTPSIECLPLPAATPPNHRRGCSAPQGCVEGALYGDPPQDCQGPGGRPTSRHGRGSGRRSLAEDDPLAERAVRRLAEP